jgi:NitT/TauT family transport system substrate-binding protein
MGLRFLLRCLLVLLLFPAASFAQTPIRLGVLKFGSVNWELDVIRRHRLDHAEGIRVERVELATNQATLVALQAGHVNAVVSDWLWVSRQRAEGSDWTFIPFSTALGAVMVPARSRIRALPDLAGQRLGVAGSPLDKSWLMLRALARQKYGIDLDEATKKSFAAPPLLAQQLESGRLDAVLTYWQFAARLEAHGASRMLGMDQVIRDLGMTRAIPLIGYVVSERWARAQSDLIRGFVRASARARSILADSDAEWDAIAPLVGAANPEELHRIRDAFRAGIPQRWGKDERGDAARLYKLLAEIGGEALVGKSAELHPGTFLDDVDY